MKSSLKYKITLTVLLVVVLIDVGCIAFNYNNYVSVNSDYIESLAATVANTCQLVIDGDSVAGYLETGQRDTQYYETWNRLIDYRNTNPDIVKLNVINFAEDGGHYVFDTNLTEEGAYLGDVCSLDSKQEKIKNQLINCEEVDAIEYRNHTDIYIPIKSSYNIPVAYVIVGISTESFEAAQLLYLLQVTGIVTGITLGFGALLIIIIHKQVIEPINQLSFAAANYSRTFGTDEASLLSQINIHTGDELERLCESMKKMENDILKSAVDLSLATWNSQHDSMTQLYNKRFYTEILEKWKDEPRVGIIYLDIDNLKKMNDTYGHDRGDEIILKAANFIHKYDQPGMFSSRVGGDEFVILIREGSGVKVDELVEKMRRDKEAILADEITDFCCRLAIGGTVRMSGEELAETIKRADENMYENKHVKR